MKKISNCFIIAAISLLFACSNEKNTDNDKVIALPSNLSFYSPFTSVDSLSAYKNNSTGKIYTLIDASCSSCFAKFKQWNDFQNIIASFSNVKVVAVCYSKDNFELVKYLFESGEIEKVNFTIFLDTNDEFQKSNLELIQNPLKFAALTDSDNRVLLLGDPINNEEDKESFLQKIHSLVSLSK